MEEGGRREKGNLFIIICNATTRWRGEYGILARWSDCTNNFFNKKKTNTIVTKHAMREGVFGCDVDFVLLFVFVVFASIAAALAGDALKNK